MMLLFEKLTLLDVHKSEDLVINWKDVLFLSAPAAVHSVVSDSFHPVDCSPPGSSILHYLLEFAQICVHWVDDAI